MHVSRVGVRFSARIEIELDVLGRNERGGYVKNGCFRANVQRGGEKEREGRMKRRRKGGRGKGEKKEREKRKG